MPRNPTSRDPPIFRLLSFHIALPASSKSKSVTSDANDSSPDTRRPNKRLLVLLGSKRADRGIILSAPEIQVVDVSEPLHVRVRSGNGLLGVDKNG